MIESHSDTAAKTYRLGVLGLGEGRSILSGATASERWDIAWACDLDEALCEQRKAEFDLPRVTTSYEEMLADPDLDAVAIYTPDMMHADHILMAIAAGKHVICTKPLVNDLRRGRELLDAVRASGLRLLVGQSCRFFDTLMRQREAYEAGVHGELIAVEAHYHGDKRQGTSGRWGKRGAVNWLYTGLSHPVDLATWYLGPIERVSAVGTQSPASIASGQQNPDVLYATLHAQSGAVGTVAGCYGAPGAHREAEPFVGCVLRGSTGTTHSTYPDFSYFENIDGRPSTKISTPENHNYYFRWGGASHHAGEFQNYLEHLSDCLDQGKAPSPGIEEGLRVIAVLDAVATSIREQRVIRVDEHLAAYDLAELTSA
ncbi:MAG: Gfo/Idh/MocA family oxidoreductase [Planctomycetota bacterium]